MSVPNTFLSDTRQSQRATGLETVRGGDGAIRLRGIATRIEDFLLQQIRRLETTIEEVQDASPSDHSVQRMIRNLNEERLHWESEQAEERERIQCDSKLLLEAWQRVEVEQRRLLAERSALSGAGGGSRRQSLATRSSMVAMEAAPAKTASGELQTRNETIPGMDDVPLAPDAAVFQFQQLRREIQQHNRRER